MGPRSAVVCSASAVIASCVSLASSSIPLLRPPTSLLFQLLTNGAVDAGAVTLLAAGQAALLHASAAAAAGAGVNKLDAEVRLSIWSSPEQRGVFAATDGLSEATTHARLYRRFLCPDSASARSSGGERSTRFVISEARVLWHS